MSEQKTNTIDPRLTFLEGRFVSLQVLTERDVLESDWVGWFNDPKHCEFTKHHYFPASFESQRGILESCITDNRIQLGVVDKENPAQICGVVSLSEIDLLHRQATVAASLCVERTKSNPFIYYEAFSLMLAHGFQQFGLEKIYGGTFHPHVVEPLVRMFNFEVEGVFKRHVYKNGTFHDSTFMSVFRDTVKYFNADE